MKYCESVTSEMNWIDNKSTSYYDPKFMSNLGYF